MQNTLKFIMKCLVILVCFCVIVSSTSNCRYRIIERGITEVDENIIVKKHNHFRQLIADGKIPRQPRGLNLKPLKWDDQLAVEAQKIADSCNYAHVKVNDSRWQVGQNLYRKRSTRLIENSDWNRAIDNWFNEHENYEFRNKNNKGTGHYTQVVWGTTEFIGCGYTLFETGEHMKYQKLYVCNYGPSGNVRGMIPYRTGANETENLPSESNSIV